MLPQNCLLRGNSTHCLKITLKSEPLLDNSKNAHGLVFTMHNSPDWLGDR